MYGIRDIYIIFYMYASCVTMYEFHCPDSTQTLNQCWQMDEKTYRFYHVGSILGHYNMIKHAERFAIAYVSHVTQSFHCAISLHKFRDILFYSRMDERS